MYHCPSLITYTLESHGNATFQIIIPVTDKKTTSQNHSARITISKFIVSIYFPGHSFSIRLFGKTSVDAASEKCKRRSSRCSHVFDVFISAHSSDARLFAPAFPYNMRRPSSVRYLTSAGVDGSGTILHVTVRKLLCVFFLASRARNLDEDALKGVLVFIRQSFA